MGGESGWVGCASMGELSVSNIWPLEQLNQIVESLKVKVTKFHQTQSNSNSLTFCIIWSSGYVGTCSIWDVKLSAARDMT